MRPLTLAALALSVGLAAALPASAATITFTTPTGAIVNGQPVEAQVTFVTSAGQIGVYLENLFDDPTSVAQNLSGLQFSVDTSGTAALWSDTGMHRQVFADGTYSDLGVLDTDWTLSLLSGQFLLNALGSGGPDQTVIGGAGADNLYGSANGSIAGNDPHNPFLASFALFLIAMPGVTPETLVTAATFLFNTSPVGITGSCASGCEPGDPDDPFATPISEPGSLLLLGTGVAAARAWTRRAQRRPTNDE